MSFWDRFKPSKVRQFSTAELLDIIGSDVRLDTTTESGQAKAYLICSALMSVINKKSQAIRNAKLWETDKHGEQVEGRGLVDKMYYPNPYQNILDFTSTISAFISVFGSCYVYRMNVPGFGNEFYVIPNNLITPVTTTVSSNPFMPEADVDYYGITIGGLYLTASKDEVRIIRDITYGFNGMFQSVSRLESLGYDVNTFTAAIEAVNELMVNRGALGIITLKAGDMPTLAQGNVPQTKEEKDAVQLQLRANYGVLRNKWKWVLTNLDAKFTPISTNIKDLGAIDIRTECKKTIADAYGVPSVLLDVADTKYANLSEAKKIFYTDTIIPEAHRIYDFVNSLYGNKDRKVMPYYDHLEFYQEAKRAQAAGLTNFINGLSTAVQNGFMTQEQATNELQNYLT